MEALKGRDTPAMGAAIDNTRELFTKALNGWIIKRWIFYSAAHHQLPSDGEVGDPPRRELDN